MGRISSVLYFLVLFVFAQIAAPATVFAAPGASCRDSSAKVTPPDYRAYLESLPETVSLPTKDREIAALYNTALMKFQKKFDRERIVELVTEIQNGGAGNLTKSEIKELKEARKLTQVMRSAFYLFTAGHEPPPEYDDFVRQFGRMNTKLKKTDKQKKVRKIAALVTAHFNEGTDEAGDYSLKLASAKSFDAFASAWISKILAAAKPGELTVEQYHDLRKWVRDFKILFDLKNAAEKTSRSRDLAAYMEFLNKQLGDSKDDFKYLEDEANGEIPASVTPGLIVLIREFFGRLS